MTTGSRNTDEDFDNLDIAFSNSFNFNKHFLENDAIDKENHKILTEFSNFLG
jgi:hypothetical protein